MPASGGMLTGVHAVWFVAVVSVPGSQLPHWRFVVGFVAGMGATVWYCMGGLQTKSAWHAVDGGLP